MSLINEALKRTRDASFQSAAHRPDSANGYRVGSTSTSTVSSRGGVGATLVVAVIAITIGSVFAPRLVKQARTLTAGFDDVVQSSPAPAPVTARKPTVQPTPAVPSKPAETDPKATEEQLVAKGMDKIKAEQAVAVAAKPPAPEPPKFVLQGVTSEGGAREAMINGINVREGDDVDGARVVTIESRRVKLQFDEREITVRLP